jgi:hypothetical protein
MAGEATGIGLFFLLFSFLLFFSSFFTERRWMKDWIAWSNNIWVGD